MHWTFYPAFIGTAISIIAWNHFAMREHVKHLPRTLSELAAEKSHTLFYYRAVLWICGPLFAITTLFFIVPRIENSLPVGIACALAVAMELLIGVFPAQRGRITAHDIIGALMGLGMTASAYLFAWSLSGPHAKIQLCFAIAMTILALLTIADRKRYIFYELPFIYLAHFSVLSAAIALA